MGISPAATKSRSYRAAPGWIRPHAGEVVSEMSRHDLPRDLNRAFEAMSGPPSPALSARVRSALNDASACAPGPVWIAGLAAAACSRRRDRGVRGFANLNRHLPAAARSVPSPSARPIVTPSANQTRRIEPSTFVAFPAAQHFSKRCAGAYIDRSHRHPSGYDRSRSLRKRKGTARQRRPPPARTMRRSPLATRRNVTLAGSSCLLFIIHGADEHTA